MLFLFFVFCEGIVQILVLWETVENQIIFWRRIVKIRKHMHDTKEKNHTKPKTINWKNNSRTLLKKQTISEQRREKIVNLKKLPTWLLCCSAMKYKVILERVVLNVTWVSYESMLLNYCLYKFRRLAEDVFRILVKCRQHFYVNK